MMDEQLSMEQYFHELDNDKTEQVDTAETIEQTIPEFNIGDTVTVIARAADAEDIETEGYLKSYEGKTGKLIRINERSNPTCYEVDFGGNERGIRNGLFYAEQIKTL